MPDLTPGFNLSHWGPIPYPAASGTKTLLGFGSDKKQPNTNKSSLAVQGNETAPSNTETPVTVGSNVSGSGGASAADIAYLDSQANTLRDMLGRSQGTLSNGLTNLGDTYNKNVSDANLQRSRTLEDYATQDQQTNMAKDNALGSVDTNARTLADSLRRQLGLAGGSDSSAYQLAAPAAVARQASVQRNGVLNDYSSNESAIDTAKTRASQDFQSLLDNLSAQRNQKESDLRAGVLGNNQNIEKQLADIAGQKASAQGASYQGALAAQNPYSAAISGDQNSIDSLFNQFRTPTFDVTPVNAQAPNLQDYTVNSAAIGTDQSQAMDPSQTLSYYLKKQQDQTA